VGLHLCWLVDEWKSSREKYVHAWLKAGWPVVLWHGGQLAPSVLDAFPIGSVALRLASDIVDGSPIERSFTYEKRFRNHAACADLFRYHVLYELGGAYSDIDVLPGRNAVLDVCNGPCPVFGRAWVPLLWELEIRFIATPAAKHPLLERLRATAVKNSEAFIDAGGHTAASDLNLVIGRTGPAMAKSVIRQYARDSGSKFSSFVLKRATNDNTEENGNEHFNLKEKIVREIASASIP
jgi:mannosyltransferase OCH1-like enzyme